jgi:hypothetical protein
VFHVRYELSFHISEDGTLHGDSVKISNIRVFAELSVETVPVSS